MKADNDEKSMAEEILDGCFCDICGEFIGEGVGYPRSCDECAKEEAMK